MLTSKYLLRMKCGGIMKSPWDPTLSHPNFKGFHSLIPFTSKELRREVVKKHPWNHSRKEVATSFWVRICFWTYTYLYLKNLFDSKSWRIQRSVSSKLRRNGWISTKTSVSFCNLWWLRHESSAKRKVHLWLWKSRIFRNNYFFSLWSALALIISNFAYFINICFNL